MQYQHKILIAALVFILTVGVVVVLIDNTISQTRDLIISAREEMNSKIHGCESKGGALLQTASGYQCFKLERITN